MTQRVLIIFVVDLQSPIFNSSIGEECIPQYNVGHGDLLQSIRQYVAQDNLPLTFVGSSYDGVGINDCVYHSQIAVDKIFNK